MSLIVIAFERYEFSLSIYSYAVAEFIPAFDDTKVLAIAKLDDTREYGYVADHFFKLLKTIVGRSPRLCTMSLEQCSSSMASRFARRDVST